MHVYIYICTYIYTYWRAQSEHARLGLLIGDALGLKSYLLQAAPHLF